MIDRTALRWLDHLTTRSSKPYDIDEKVDRLFIDKTLETKTPIISKRQHKISPKPRKKMQWSKILLPLISIALVLGLILTNLPVFYGGGDFDINISIEPADPVEGDLIFINATIPTQYNITQVWANISGVNTINLSLIDNTTTDQLWQGTWILHNLSAGDYIVNISAVDFLNTSYYMLHRWIIASNFSENESVEDDTVSPENNSAPVFFNMYPANESIGLDTTPVLNVTVSDPDGDLMNISWYSNSSGTWEVFGTNISVGNGTYNQTNANFSDYNTTYWWYVSVSDGFDTNNSSVFHFKTKSEYVLAPPRSFTATVYNSTQINLTWTRGALADATYIVRKTGSYPSNRADGINVYNGTNTWYNDTDLAPSTTYYYSAWSYNTSNFSWSEDYITASATTVAEEVNVTSDFRYTNVTVSPSKPPPGFYVSDRGTNWNRYYNPSTGQHSIVAELGPRNYQDEQGDWHPINCSFEPLDGTHPAYQYGYRAGNEKGLFNAYFKPNLQDTWPVAFAYNKSDDPTMHILRSKLMGIGYLDPSSSWDYKILQQVQNSHGVIDGSSGTYPGVFSGVNVTWRYANSGLKEEIILSNTTKTLLQGNPPSSFGLSNQHSYLVFVTKLDYQNLHPYNSSTSITGNYTLNDGCIEFKDMAGMVRCSLPVDYAYELYAPEPEPGNETDKYKRMTFRLIQHNGEYYLLSGIKVTTLNTMTFPVVFDPSIQVNVSAGVNDAHEADDNSGYDRDSSFCYATGSPVNSERYNTGLCFKNIEVAQGNTIADAYVKLDGTIYDDPQLIISCHDVDNSQDFADNEDVTTRVNSRTSSTTSWSDTDIGSDWHNTPDFKGAVQEVINRAGWSSGNNITVLLEGTTTAGAFWIGAYELGTPHGHHDAELYVNYTTPLIVITNESTGVEETNATLHGYLSSDSGATTTCGFWLDTVSGGTSTNITFGTVSEGNAFSNDSTGLTPGQLYYFKAWASNSVGFNGTANEKTFLTKPNVTTSFNATAYNKTQINLTWVNGDGANNTYIERNQSGSVWARGDGEMIYNDSGASYEDTGLSWGTIYYYQAWSYANWTYNPTLTQWSDENASASNTTIPNKPPNKPTLNAPSPSGTYVNTPNVVLNVTVTDPNSDTMNVSFYVVNVSLTSEEWTKFHNYNNNTGYTSNHAVDNISNTNVTTFATGGDVVSSPAVANGYVYVGSNDNKVYQLNASNISQKIAEYTTGGNVDSSPAVANGYVYVGSDDSKVYQLNASDISQKIAEYTTGDDVESSPAVANGYVYVGSWDNKVYQLNASNISIQVANFTTGNDVYYSSPAVANGYVYVGSLDNKLYQLNASDISQKIASYDTGSNVVSSPAVANGYVYVGSVMNNKLYQLNASNISQKIAEYTTGGFIFSSSPAVANGYVYIGTWDDKVYQLNASNISQKIAEYTTGDIVESSPVVANGYVYVGSQDDKLYQLNASDISQKIAEYTTGGNVDSSPAVANGYVYVGSRDNKLYQFGNGALGDEKIGEDTNVPDTGYANVTWSGLSDGTTYQWYAVASDGFLENQSDTWIFTVDTTEPTCTIEYNNTRTYYKDADIVRIYANFTETGSGINESTVNISIDYAGGTDLTETPMTKTDNTHWYYDLDIPAGSSYDGQFTVNITAQDNATNPLNPDPTQDNSKYIDNTKPTSSVNSISPYLQVSSPLPITASASDGGSGVDNVTLWYRWSSVNSSWGSWVQNTTDTSLPWGWNFNFTNANGTGYYEFYSRSYDNVSNYEDAPGSADAMCHYTALMNTSVDTITPYEQTTSPLTINATSTGATPDNVTLWYRYSSDNSSWWNTSWSYRKSCNISGNIDDYQMKIIVGNSSGGNITCGGHAQSDFDDIRFVNSTGNELPYWRENYTADTQATFWVNNSNNDTHILMYYGHSTISTTSNGVNTFLFFDGCEDGNVDEWTTEAHSSHTAQITASISRPYTGIYSIRGYINPGNNGNNPDPKYYRDFSITENQVIEFWWNIDDVNNRHDSWYPGENRLTFLNSTGSTIFYTDLARDNQGGNGGLYTVNNVPDGNYQVYGSTSSAHEAVHADEWHHSVIKNINWAAKTLDAYLYNESGDLVYNAIGVSWSNDGYPTQIQSWVDGWEDDDQVIFWDNILTRKYSSNGPTWSSFGSEEQWMQWTGTNPDEDSPWSWEFNFTNANGTGYYEFYSIGKKTGSVDETPPNTADASCHYQGNYVPTVDFKTPGNGSTGISPCPAVICEAYVNDTDGDNLDVTWATNESGSWANKYTNNSVTANTTVSYQFTNFSNYSQIYYWRVYVDDGTDNVSETYHFTTQAINTSVDSISPYEQTTSPLTINASAEHDDYSNVTLWYRYSSNNASWGSNWWNASWTYRKSCTVTNNIDDYQMKIIVGNSSGGNVTCDGHAQSDFDDIRFVNSTGNELPYWRENYTADTQATFWINNSYNDSKIWMYYGNSDVSTTSNGTDTFLWFDDFAGEHTLSDYTITDKGDTNTPSNWEIDTANEKLIQHSNIYHSNYNDFGSVVLTGLNVDNISVHYRSKEVDNDDLGVLMSYQDSSNYYSFGYFEESPDKWYITEDGVRNKAALTSRGDAVSRTTIYTFDIYKQGSSLKMYKDNSPWLTTTDSTYGSGDVGLYTFGCDEGEFHPPFYVRNYRSTEPSWSSFGSEDAWMAWNNASQNPDTESPWSWNFTFPNGTGYYEFYSIGKKSGSTDETAPSSADAICRYNPNTSINVTPSQWDIGTIDIGDTNETTSFHFNLTNEGSVALDITINATHAKNTISGAQWNLTTTPAHDNFSLQYNLSGGGGWIPINITFDTFVAGLAIGGYQTFDLKLLMATTSSTVDPMEVTVTFKSVKA